MSVTLITAILFVAQPAAVDSNMEEEMVAIGERLKQWTGKYKLRSEAMSCTTVKSTGDSGIDAIGCAAVESCATKLNPQIMASNDVLLDGKLRKALKKSLKIDFDNCVQEDRAILIQELAASRR